MSYGCKLPHTPKRLAGEYSQEKVKDCRCFGLNRQKREKSPFHFDFLGKSLLLLK